MNGSTWDLGWDALVSPASVQLRLGVSLLLQQESALAAYPVMNHASCTSARTGNRRYRSPGNKSLSTCLRTEPRPGTASIIFQSLYLLP